MAGIHDGKCLWALLPSVIMCICGWHGEDSGGKLLNSRINFGAELQLFLQMNLMVSDHLDQAGRCQMPDVQATSGAYIAGASSTGYRTSAA